METRSWVAFSQDHGRFAYASRTTYRVFQCDPFKELFHGQTSWLIDMVEVSSSRDMVALALTDKREGSPKHMIQLFNFSQNKQVRKLDYDEKVCRIRIQKDYLAVVLERRIDLLRASGVGETVLPLETPLNTNGLCAATDKKLLAFPGIKSGEVCVHQLTKGPCSPKLSIKAHTSALACLSISLDGRQIVTASVRGTLVRVFETEKGTLLYEFRRGIDQADIYSVSFSSGGQWLTVSSSKGTIHLFSLRGATLNSNHQTEENNGLLGRVKAMIRPVSSLATCKSFAQLHVPKESPVLVGFGRDGENTILVLGLDGCFNRCRFDPLQGGEMDDTLVTKLHHVSTNTNT